MPRSSPVTPATIVGSSPCVTAAQRQWQEKWTSVNTASTPLLYATVDLSRNDREAKVVVMLRLMSLGVGVDFETVVQLLRFLRPATDYVFTEAIRLYWLLWFLVACMQLYTLPCRSVGRCVRPSVRRSVTFLEL